MIRAHVKSCFRGGRGSARAKKCRAKARTEPRPPGSEMPPGLISAYIIVAVLLTLTIGSKCPADQLSFLRPTIESCQPKLVKVFGAGAGRIESYATGILVSADGHVLTTQGAILDGRRVRVLTTDGSSYDASVLKRDRKLQLALLKIDARTPEHFTLGEQSVGQKGDWVLALSNAFRVADKDEPLSVMMGIISLRTSMTAKLNSRDIAYQGDLVLIDVITSNPGAGGGAVVTSDGKLVGMIGKIINSSKTNTRLNYAVPNATLYRFFNGLQEPDAAQKNGVQPGNIAAVDLGIRIFRLGGKRDPAYVDRVISGSPAAAAGIKPDDLIVSIAGVKIGNVRQFEQVIKQPTDGSDQILVVKRGRKLLRLTVSTGEKGQ